MLSSAVQECRSADRAIRDFDQLRQGMAALGKHRVFACVRSPHQLRIFMQWHVYAVWDFMSLVKRLQRDLTCVSVPWLPPVNASAARLINEIVIGEESDETGTGGHASHFDLYLRAMREVGADCSAIQAFIRYVREGFPVAQALERVEAPIPVASFVLSTLQTACHGSTHEVLGSFFFGRENVIPMMFNSLLKDWTVDPTTAPTFVYYLKRHIELDGDDHGPAAERIIRELLRDDPVKQAELISAARHAVNARLALWDALADMLVGDQH